MRWPNKKISDSVVEKIAEIEATMNKTTSPRVKRIMKMMEGLAAPPVVPGPNTQIQPITPEQPQDAQTPPMDEAAMAGADVGGMVAGGNAFDAIVNPQL